MFVHCACGIIGEYIRLYRTWNNFTTHISCEIFFEIIIIYVENFLGIHANLLSL